MESCFECLATSRKQVPGRSNESLANKNNNKKIYWKSYWSNK